MQGSSTRALGGLAARLLRRRPRVARIEVALADGRAWSVPIGRRGATVRCTAGLLWVTQEGDHEDHLLRAGEALRVARAGRLALVALGPARGEVWPPA